MPSSVFNFRFINGFCLDRPSGFKVQERIKKNGGGKKMKERDDTSFLLLLPTRMVVRIWVIMRSGPIPMGLRDRYS